MGLKIVNLRDTVFRIYAASTYYLIVPFADGTLGPFPVAPPRPEEMLQLNQGLGDANHHRIIETDQPTFDRISIPMTFMLEASINAKKAFTAMSNPEQESPWRPDDTNTWSPVTSLGTRVNGAGTAVTCVAPGDSVKVAGLVNVEVFATNPDASGDDVGLKFTGCYFDPPRPSISNPTGTFETTMHVYGAIAELAAFTAGTAI